MRFRLLHCFTPALWKALIILAFCSNPALVFATAEVQWHSPRFQYVANDRSVRTVLKKFASKQQLRITIAPSVTGRVVADFDVPAGRLLEILGEQYHFSWRVDGNRLYIEPQRQPAAVMLSGTDALRQKTDGGIELQSSRIDQLPAERQTSVVPMVVDPALAPLRVWTTTPTDKTLQNALARWSIAAGWQLFWELPQDYSIEATASINGSFEDAVTTVTNSLQQGDAPVVAIFYEGNRVLRMVAKGAQ